MGWYTVKPTNQPVHFLSKTAKFIEIKWIVYQIQQGLLKSSKLQNCFLVATVDIYVAS